MSPAAKGVRFSGGELCEAEAPTEPAGETHTDVCQDFLCKMTAEDTVQMDGVRFLKVPLLLFHSSSCYSYVLTDKGQIDLFAYHT